MNCCKRFGVTLLVPDPTYSPPSTSPFKLLCVLKTKVGDCLQVQVVYLSGPQDPVLDTEHVVNVTRLCQFHVVWSFQLNRVSKSHHNCTCTETLQIMQRFFASLCHHEKKNQNHNIQETRFDTQTRHDNNFLCGCLRWKLTKVM